MSTLQTRTTAPGKARRAAKGKTVKKITAVKPKCPSGFKRR